MEKFKVLSSGEAAYSSVHDFAYFEKPAKACGFKQPCGTRCQTPAPSGTECVTHGFKGRASEYSDETGGSAFIALLPALVSVSFFKSKGVAQQSLDNENNI